MAESSSYKEYVAGLLAGVATVITGHPFDTVKVHISLPVQTPPVIVIPLASPNLIPIYGASKDATAIVVARQLL